MHMIMCVFVYMYYCGLRKIVYSGICLFIQLLASKCPQRLLCAGHRPGLLNPPVDRMNALPPCQPSSSRENKHLVIMNIPPKAASTGKAELHWIGRRPRPLWTEWRLPVRGPRKLHQA